MTHKLIVGMILLAAIAPPAAAKPGGKTLTQELTSNSNRFVRVDTNGDSKISQEEYLVENTRIAERDGKPVSNGTGGTYGSNNDRDGDGMVSLVESQTYVSTLFTKNDANKDGIVTEEEKAAAKGK